jgi:hypothetical protein
MVGKIGFISGKLGMTKEIIICGANVSSAVSVICEP